MYQKVSIANWCSPVDWPPALMAQMLNQPAFLIVPSGFSTTRVWWRGTLEISSWALALPNSRQDQHRSSRLRNVNIGGSSVCVEAAPGQRVHLSTF